MIGSVRAELLRLRRWPALWVLCGTWLLLNLTFGYLFDYLSYRSGDSIGPADAGVPPQVLLHGLLPAQVPITMVQGLPIFGGALLLILGALAFGSGYGWGTWKTVFTAGPRRSTALGGTLAALGIVLVCLIAVSFVLDLAASLAIAAAESAPMTLPSLLHAAQGLGSGLLIAGMWTGGGMLLGTVTRGPALSIGLGLVWALVVENLLRGLADVLGPLRAVTDVLPGTAAGSLVGAIGGIPASDPGGTPGVTTILGGPAAIALLAAYVVVFLGAGLTLTTRRDLTS
jgi:ABC-type transport system involved in multi-copper enzyme maturation permease subunit